MSRSCTSLWLASLVSTVAVAQPAPGHKALGVVEFPISCSGPARQAFGRGVALLHHMTYPSARETFTEVAAIDPRCAMAHWGIAMTLFQPLWPTRPSRDDLRRGHREIDRATELEPPTERERRLIAAAAAFFQDPNSADYWSRIRGWEAGMARAHEQFPDDPEVSAFYALSLLAAGMQGGKSADGSRRAVELLLAIHRRNPNHPGAMHYLIHADDVPGHARDHLAIDHRYEDLAPDNAHALHMPTHLYTRLGDWDRVVRGNTRARDAALRSPAGEHGDLVWDEFPHAIEYLVYAWLQQGVDGLAAREIDRLRSTPRLEPSAKTAFHLVSTRARYALERQAWTEAAALAHRESTVVSWDRYPWPDAIGWFARGLGAAHLGRLDDARQAESRITDLEAGTRHAGERIFADQIELLRLELSGWIRHTARADSEAVASLERAAALEAATPKPPVTPAPTLPALELLGDLLLEMGRPAEALAAYEKELELYPGRFNGLLGAARAARRSNDSTRAARAYAELVKVAGRGTRKEPLDEARRFLAPSR